MCVSSHECLLLFPLVTHRLLTRLRSTSDYLRKTAELGGFKTEIFVIGDLGWNKVTSQFLSPKGEPVRLLFKLYPWEWLFLEDEDQKLLKADVIWVEPPWKAVLSNKGLLPILWELFPAHPTLLASFWSQEEAEKQLGKLYVSKPLLGREGQNVTIRSEQGEFSVPGIYTDQGFIYQQVCMPPRMGTRWAAFGGWVVGDIASGLAVREDGTPILTNHSSFIPHIVPKTQEQIVPKIQEQHTQS